MQSSPRVPPGSMFPERRYGSLRMMAASCVISAWISLVLSLVFGFSMLAVPVPSLPGGVPGYTQRTPYGGGLEDGLGTSPAGSLGGLLSFASGLRVAGGIATIAGGVLTFFGLLAIGYGIHLLLDMEENTRITAQAMAQIARRMGQ